MRRNELRVILILFALLIGTALVYGQEVHKLVADIPHAFTVSGTQLPAGRYEFDLSGATHRNVVVRSEDGKNNASGLIVTSIAAEPGRPADPRLVFDNFGGQYILAEVWLPGHDGFLISGFKNDSEHKHEAVKAMPSKKP